MASEPIPDPSNVIPIRAEPTGTELALAAANPPAYLTGKPAIQRRPVIPPHLQRANLRGTLTYQAGLRSHQTLFHGIRLPGYLAVTLWHAGRGAKRAGAGVGHWAGATGMWKLESQAVAHGRQAHSEAMAAHREGKKTRGARARILGVCLGFALAAGVLVWAFAPWPVWAVLIAVLLLILAGHGKPEGKQVIKAAIVPPTYQPPTPEIITRALGALGITQINEAIRGGHGITFVSDVHRDGEGWGCDLDLPHGVTAKMILARREQLASGLRRPLSATWPEGVPHEHEGRLRLWIGYSDLAKVKPKTWPLLRAGQADIFASVPFGTDPRGRQVDAPVFEMNWLIGAAPGQGKTSAVRVLACGTALDPIADLWVHELAGKGDLEPLAQVSHRYCSGLDDDAISYAAESVRMLRAELERRSKAFSQIDKADKPDGKLTRDLAGRRSLRLRPVVCVVDECQNLFMHPELGDQAAADAAYVIRLGRAYGLVLVVATQRPDRDSLPTAVSANCTARFCLRVGGHVENDMILGTSAHQNGYRATAFRAKTDAGLGWLKGDGDPGIVKTYYLDLPACERVAARARVMREAAGVLSGYALGLAADEPPRSFAADVLSVFGTADKLWSATIAARLAESIPAAYADITTAAVTSQLRSLGITVKKVREPGQAPGWGCDRTAVEQVTP